MDLSTVFERTINIYRHQQPLQQSMDSTSSQHMNIDMANITEITLANRAGTFDMNNSPLYRRPSLVALYPRFVH